MLIPLQNHKIIGEETSNKPELTHSPTWVIDPVDGTTNFVSGSPYVAVCIGFMVNKKIQCGVVYNPILDECFSQSCKIKSRKNVLCCEIVLL